MNRAEKFYREAMGSWGKPLIKRSFLALMVEGRITCQNWYWEDLTSRQSS